MYLVGIDPGLSGAIAVLLQRAGHASQLTVIDMPTLDITVAGKRRRRLDLAALAGALSGVAVGAPDVVLIEDVSGRPPGLKGSQSGAFMQGFNAAAPVAICAALGLPYNLVVPAVWKKAMGTPADKDGARLAASRLFPEFAHLWARSKDDGRAEAALLAAFAARRVQS
jgi:hypothetical protein